MNRTFVALACAGALAAAGAVRPSAAAGHPDSSRAEVQQFVKSYVEAQNRADATAMMEMFIRKPAASSINEGRLMHGWEAIRDAADEMAGAEGSFKLALGTMEIASLGAGNALVVAPFTLTVGSDDGSTQIHGALTLVLEKAGGKWKIIHEHQSAQPPDEDEDQQEGD